MRIIWAMDFDPYKDEPRGGDVYSTRILAEGLRKRGHELYCISPKWWDNKMPWYMRTVWRAQRFGKFIGGAIRDYGDYYSVVIAQNHVYPYVINEARKYGMPTVMVARDKRYRCQNFPESWRGPCVSSCASCMGMRALAPYPWFKHHVSMMRKMAAASDAQVVPSTHMADDMRRTIPGTDPAVVYPPIDNSHFPKKWKPKDVVFMGKGSYKGADIVANVARELENEDFKFRIYGNQHPDHKRAFERLENVEYCGFRPRTEVFEHAKLVIAPSRWSEPAGRNVCEAVYMGVPCLISDRGGVPETMGAGGEVVPNEHLEDTAYWADRVRDLMCDDVWKIYSRAARNHGMMVEASSMVDRFEKVLEGVIS